MIGTSINNAAAVEGATRYDLYRLAKDAPAAVAVSSVRSSRSLTAWSCPLTAQY
jgi:trehalose-6-phosphatase